VGYKPSEFFRRELEVPVEELLTHEQELSGARNIRILMARLKRILPHHPVGYRLFLHRMEEVGNEVSSFFAWHKVKPQIAGDLSRVAKALRRAEALAPENPEGAVIAFRKGVQVLRKYPLDPETLYQWAKEVAEGKRSVGALDDIERFRKVHRIVRRLTRGVDLERDGLVLPNLRLILREVFRFPAKGMYESDLFQEGFLGLSKAVFRYNPDRNLRFSTYATHWIRQSIRKALIDKASLIRLPQALHERRGRLRRNVNEKELQRLHKMRSNMVMFSTMTSDDDTPFDVGDRRTPGISETLHTEEIPYAIRKALQNLSEPQREVLSRRFGLEGWTRQTLEEIGLHMSLSRERIRQIEKSALEEMRESLELRETYEDLSVAAAPSVGS
jgi:RNA polymerase sigma factor (sigma-70 family)